MKGNIISEEELDIYLYVACCNIEDKKNQAYFAIVKAILFNEVAINMENAGSCAILFSSKNSYESIKKSLTVGKIPYLLINIGSAFDLECVSGFIPNSDIEMIKKISDQKFSKNKSHLKRILAAAIENENFELAAPVRDITKINHEKNRKSRAD